MLNSGKRPQDAASVWRLRLSKWRLQNPPLAEAIFEVVVLGPSSWPVGADDVMRGALGDLAGPEVRIEPRQLQAHFQFGQATPVRASEHVLPTHHLRWDSAEQRRAVQFGERLCALNVVRNYGQFEDHVPLLEQAWAAWREQLPAQTQVRLGQRYINKIVMPVGLPPRDVFTGMAGLGKNAGLLHEPFRIQGCADRGVDFVVAVDVAFLGANDAVAEYLFTINANSGQLSAGDAELVDWVGWQREVHGSVRTAFRAQLSSTYLNELEGAP